MAEQPCIKQYVIGFCYCQLPLYAQVLF